MRLVVRIGLVILALVALAVLALVVAIPRIARSPEFRAEVQTAARAQLGRDVDWEDVSLGLLPPSIVVQSLSVSGAPGAAGAATPDFLRAESVSLRLALLPLLGGTVLVDSLVIQRPAVRLVQTAAGLDLPGPPQDEPTEEPAEGGDSAVSLAIREVLLRDARIDFEDRTQAPPLSVVLEEVNLALRGRAVDAPLDVEASLSLGSGGRLRVAGTAELSGRVDLRAELEEVALAPYAGFVEKGAVLDALLGGVVEILGDPAAPERLALDLGLEAKQIRTGDTRVEGRVDVDATLSGALARPRGDFTLDASQARIAYADSFDKAAGRPLVVAGQLAPGASGAIEIALARFDLDTLAARGKVELGERTRLRLDAASFDITNWDTMLPALAGQGVSGSLALRGLDVRTSPLSIGGEIVVGPLDVTLSETGKAKVEGVIAGRGDALELQHFTVSTNRQAIAVAGRVSDLENTLRFQLEVGAAGLLSANDLLTGLGVLEDTLYGPLEFNAKLSGAAGAQGSENALLDSLAGKVKLDLGRGVGTGDEGGRLKGVSVLEGSLGRKEVLASASGLIMAATGKPVGDLERFFGDEFERLEGELDIAKGKLETRRLRIVYRDYGVNLRGTIGLADQSLDMTGDLELGPQVVGALGGSADSGLVVPLAKVGGTVAEPKFGVSSAALSTLASRLAVERAPVKRVLEQADKVAPGAADIMKKGLGRILGGDR